MIISFAWTSNAFLRGQKTVTRRFWCPGYATKFKPGITVDAYDKSPRFGGNKIGQIKIVRVYKQYLSEMTDDDEKKEGGLWGNARAFVEAMGGPSRMPYVVEFVKL